MKRKNIDTMREVRLWIGQIVVPAITVVGSAVATKAEDWKQSIERKIKRKENEAR